MKTMEFGPTRVECPCGWSTDYVPPLVTDNPRMSIDGSATHPFINCKDSAGKLIRHSHPDPS
jgi:hypothetical protein